MMLPNLFAPGWADAFLNHLLQSTAVALLAWLLTIALRANAARVRYAIWMIASIKFLMPFSLLTRIGEHWAKPLLSKQGAPAVYSVVEEFSVPFQQLLGPGSGPVSLYPAHSNVSSIACILIAAAWLCGCLMVLARWILAWRGAAVKAKQAEPISEGREFDALRRAETKAKVRKLIALALSSREIEPGVFGTIRPVLLWPAGLSNRLDDAQIDAIMVHEAEHVRRRDNLTTAIHALVEALFWFHPLVRWMSVKLNEERERACDEKVLEREARPEAYADGILKVCAFCLEPPSPCVSGVSGADLKDRILRIMARRSGAALNSWRKVALASAAILALALPVGIGVVHGQVSAAGTDNSGQVTANTADLPKYDVASIKPYKADDGRVRMMITPDGVSLQGAPMRLLLPQAFGVEEDRILGAPAWVKSNRYNIEAKVEPDNAPKLKDLKVEQRNAMMLQLLVDRFNLKYHYEKRELPTYALVVAKDGLKMKPTKADLNAPAADAPRPGDAPLPGDGRRPPMGKGMLMINPGHIESTGASVEMLTHVLSRQLGRTVVDKTGLKGEYDFALDYTPDNMPMPPHGASDGGPKPEMQVDTGGPSIFTAVEEQLGLKLEATKGMVDVIVIDHIDLPTEN